MTPEFFRGIALGIVIGAAIGIYQLWAHHRDMMKLLRIVTRRKR